MTVGFIVNPIAGMGGRVALKGTDGAQSLELAIARGATAIAPGRADRALARLQAGVPRLTLMTGRGSLGGDLAHARALETKLVRHESGEPTAAADTRSTATEMAESGVDLIMFAGGDGTARDIYDSVGARTPVIGIPTGVKMYSGVFASGPEAAGDTAAGFLNSPASRQLRDGDVADADEDAIREGRVATRIYGSLRVPLEHSRMLAAKSSGPRASEGQLSALVDELVRELEPGVLYVIGPGSTTGRVLDQLGLTGTLLGVDALRDGRLVGRDLGEQELLALLSSGPARIITGVIGGQGFLFGRGNQQISPRVIRRVGAQGVTVLADSEKLARLSPPWLRVDTGDAAVDEMLCGYRSVRVGPGRSMMMRITT